MSDLHDFGTRHVIGGFFSLPSVVMNLHDLISDGSEYVKANRPQHPDIDRISDIVLEMKAITADARNIEEHEAMWKEWVERIIDFDSLAWQAFNVALDIFGIKTAYDLRELRSSKRKNKEFIGSMQAFYDGFLLGATFQDRGGHREK